MEAINLSRLNVFKSDNAKKALQKQVIKKSHDLNKVFYSKQRNYYVSFVRKEKKEYFAKFNEKRITDNRRFWYTVKPFLSGKVKSKDAIILVNNDRYV